VAGHPWGYPEAKDLEMVGFPGFSLVKKGE